MPTAQTLMDRALGSLGVLAVGESASGSTQTDALAVLNSMIDEWLISGPMVYQILQTTKTLTAGDGSYSVYSGGDISVARPVDVEETSFIRFSSTDYGLTKVDRQTYNAISDKTSQGMPELMFYDSLYAQPVLYLYPVPDQAYTLYLDYWGPISTFATAATNNALPPAYEGALWKNLALELWPFYPNPGVYNQVSRSAALSRAAIDKLNTRIPILANRYPGGHRFNILTGP